MRRLTVSTQFALSVLLLSSTLHAQAGIVAPQIAPASKGTISGTVTRVATGDPIAKVTVTLSRVNAPAGPLAPAGANAGARGAGTPGQPGGPQGQQPNIGVASVQVQQPPAVVTMATDEQGKFQFKDVDAGAYRVIAARNGFARQEYGQRSLNRPGTVLNIRAGQQINDIAFKLTPAGTISGRVLDSTGEPLVGVTIQALRSSFDATGKRNMQPVGSARTNDLGEYRLYWINPGRYFVNANAARSALELISSQAASQASSQTQSPEQAQAAASAASMFGAGANPNEVADTGFGLTYYPGTTDATRAVAVDLQPGNEIRAIDFVLVRQQRVKLSGRVVDGETGRPPQMAQVSASSREATSASSPLDALIGGDPTANRYNPTTGEFVVQNVATGSYWLQVMAQGANTPNPAAGGQIDAAAAIAALSSINTARVPIEVGTTDIDNLSLTVTSGVSVPGRIRLEGAPAGGANPLERIRVTLQVSGPLSFLSLLGGGGVAPAADGTFSIPRISTGDYKLAVNGLGPNLYIKEARLGQTDAMQPLSIVPPVNGTLDITLGSNPGRITGIVTDATLKPVSGVLAVLIPDQLRNRQDLYKTVTTDQEGRFTVLGITPGDYRLFSWEDIEPFSYYDPAVLRQYEQQGKLVHIQEGATDSVDVKIIPAGTP